MNKTTTKIIEQLADKFPHFFPYYYEKVVKESTQNLRRNNSKNVEYGSKEPQISRFIQILPSDNNKNTSL
jgi:hypothetical protein